MRIRKNIFKLLAVQLMLVGTLAAAGPPLAYAAPNGQQGQKVQVSGDQSDINAGELPQPDATQAKLRQFLQIAFGIIGAFAVLSITLSGLKYITSAGNEQKTSEAKNGIVYSVVGLMIAITAEAIIAFIVNGAS